MAVSARPRRQAPGTGAIALGQVPSRFAARLTGRLMAWWLRRARGRALPAKLRVQLAFARGERTLLVGRDPDGGYALVATDRALHHQAGRDDWSRLGWEQITAVAWETSVGRETLPGRETSAGCLVVTGLPGTAPARVTVPLRQRGTWPELAAERITHTRLARQGVLLDGGQRVVIEVRRRPGTGEVRWVLVSGRKPDPGDRDLRHQIDQAANRLCADLGITLTPSSEQAVLATPFVGASGFALDGLPPVRVRADGV